MKIDSFNRQLGVFALLYVYGDNNAKEKEFELRVPRMLIRQAYHVRMVFTRKKIMIYVDGKERASADVTKELKRNTKIAFGGHLVEDKKFFGGISKTLLDDIKIQKSPF